MDPERRQEALEEARLYFVCDAGLQPGELDALLGAALAGGVDMLQLRDKHAPEPALRAAAAMFAEAAAESGALFLINDDPVLAAACGADGVHVGQSDAGVATAREITGEGAIVGLSTHFPEQLEAALTARGAALPDYVSIGPVWETPTKEGRPAAGLAYVEHAAERIGGGLPWFAIGSIDPDNVGRVTAAGAGRVVVVRAIRHAENPGAVAARLRDALAAGGEVRR